MICGLAGPFGVGFFGYWGIQFTVPAVILGVLALVLGYAGWYQIKSSDGRLGATWMAYLAWFFGVLAIAAPFTATV